MKALVTGASGFTGSRLCAHLRDVGYEVRALVRSSSNLQRLSGIDVELAQADLADDSPLDEALEGVDVVFHVAAAFRSEGIPLAVFRATNADGTRRLLEAAEQVGVHRFLHTSTVGVQGHIDEGPADEQYRFNPGDHYQRTKLEGERIALDFAASGRVPVTVVRPAGIYGPGDLRFLKLFRFVRNGRFRMIGSGEVRYHFTYVDDLVRGMRVAAEHPDAPGEVFTIGGRDAVTLNRLVEIIAGILGVEPPRHRLRIPVAPVMAAATVCEWICRPFGIDPPLFRRRVDFFTHNRWFDISKAERVLGFTADVGLEEGLRRMADWYRIEGLL